MLKRHSVPVFVLIVLVVSLGSYFLPLPAETKSLLVPLILAFVPTLVVIPLVWITEGPDGLRRLFSSMRGAWKWVLIGTAVGAFLRLSVLALGIILGTSIRADFAAPETVFILIVTIPFAWFEELGWRRFALDRLLGSRSPLEASLLLGFPWALIHLILLLPGMMSAGAPAIPQTIVLIALSVFLTWTYVHSGGSLLGVTLLHGVQNGLVILNRGVTLAEGTWLMMGVYVLLAVLLVVLDRRTFFARKVKPSPPACASADFPSARAETGKWQRRSSRCK